MNFTDVFGSQTVPPAEESFAEYAVTGTESHLVWPDQYGGQGLLLADITELTPSGGSVQVTLPPADAVSRGESFILRNRGAESIELLNTDSVPQALLLPGESLFLYIDDNATPAGGWSSFVYGTGTSAADASELAGRGLVVESGRLNANAEYRALNSNYLMSEIDRAQVLDATVGTLTIITPDAISVGNGFYAFIRNSSAGDLTVEGSGSQTINSAPSLTMSPGDSIVLICTGTGWVTVGFGRSVSGAFSETIVNAAAGDIILGSDDVSGRMIRVTGVASSDITVTLPATDNIYFVSIDPSVGAFNVVFTTGSGLVSSLTANQRTVLSSDGTNVVSAVTTTVTSTLALVDGSAAAPSINFSLDPDTGIFRKANNVIGFAVGGVEAMSLTPTGATLAFPLPLNQGGTGATTAEGVRTALGLDGRYVQRSNNLSDLSDIPTARQNLSINNVTNDAQLKIASNLSDVANAATAFNNIKQSATDAYPGVVELATNAEAQAGVDTTRAVTPAGAKAAITSSLIGAFPVGAVYITATNTNPGTFLGGTWTQIAQGRTLIGVGSLSGDTYTAGATGGLARVTLSIDQLPSHNHGGVTGGQSNDHSHAAWTDAQGSHQHSYIDRYKVAGTGAGDWGSPNEGGMTDQWRLTEFAGNHAHNVGVGGVTANHNHSIPAQGGWVPHENRMPYLAVFFWQRTA